MRRAPALFARLAVPLAAGLAAATLAAYEVAPGAAAETRYLALLATAVLLPVAALAEASLVALGGGATLAVTLLWAVPAGPQRGAALVALLLALLALVAARSLARDGRTLSAATLVPLALALQLLARSDRLLMPGADLRSLGGLLGLPVAAGLAVALLGERHGPRRPLVACATAFVLGGGFTVAGVAPLAALALAAAGEGWRPARRWLAVAALLLPLALVQPPLALLTLAAVAAVEASGSWRWALLGVGVAGGLGLSGVAGPPGVAGIVGIAGWRELGWLPLLLPGLAAGAPRSEAPRLGAALLVLLGAGCAAPATAALAAPLVALALCGRDTEPAGILQATWSGTLAAGTALLAAYPWLRPEPGRAALGLLGLEPHRLSLLLVPLALVVLGLTVTAARRAGLARWLTPVPLALALVAAGLACRFPGGGRILLEGEPVVLSAARPAWQGEIGGAPITGVALDSTLTNAAHLAAGTPVAELRLTTADGAVVRRVLAVGSGTDEWAARRPDVARELAAPPPPAWLSWVAEDGRFFAQRYRDLWTGGATAARRLELVRAPGLPADVEVVLFHLEVRR